MTSVSLLAEKPASAFAVNGSGTDVFPGEKMIKNFAEKTTKVFDNATFIITIASGIRHQASGIRHQASGIRHQASGSLLRRA
jgi:hypothetical protein